MKQPLVSIDALPSFQSVIDVRSPGEFSEDHLPGAINCPVLNDEERARVGTIYKQESPFAARKIGAALVSRNIAQHLETQFHAYPKNWRPLVYCWRGGQRSGAMVTILRQVGWDAQQLDGGYKAYRRHVVEQLTRLPTQFKFIVITGATGSAKTRVLQEIARQGQQVLDLEGLACHKGSVLGATPNAPQPSQKLFESTLHQCLTDLDPALPVFVEAESRRIGGLHLPEQLITAMRSSPCVAINADRLARVAFLLQDYHYFVQNADHLMQRLNALRPLRGSALVDTWCNLVQAGRWPDFVEQLLAEHYDALYEASQAKNYQANMLPLATLRATRLDERTITQLAQDAIAATQHPPA